MSRLKKTIKLAWKRVVEDEGVRDAIAMVVGAIVAVASTALRRGPRL